MKRFLIMLKLCSASAVLSMGLATASFAQGSFGAGSIILTDTRGHQLTIVPPVLGTPEYDAWAAIGFQNILWGIPIPPTDTAQGAFIYSGPMNIFTTGPSIGPRSLAYWVPPGQQGIHNTGGHAGAWDWASATDLGLMTTTGPLEGNLNVITDPGGNVTTMPPGDPNTVLHTGAPPYWGAVTNLDLENSSLTISPGTGLSGGGVVALGGSTTLNLANTTVAEGTYGDPTHVASFTVDPQGRLTAAVLIGITGVTPGGPAGGDLAGTYPDPTIANTTGAGNNIIAALTTSGGTLTNNTTGTASALSPGANINGVPFTGAADITVKAEPIGPAGGDLTGTYPDPMIAITPTTGYNIIAALTANGGLLTNSTSGNAATASALNPGANINGVPFNGTADITIVAAPIGVAGGDLAGTYPDPTIANTAGAGNNIIAALSASGAPLSNSILGNAATATVLSPGANINGVPFTGGANITITAVPSGPAGGDLTGTYPDPTIANTAGNDIIAALNNFAATNDPLYLPVDMQITGSHTLGIGGSLTVNNGFYSPWFATFGDDLGNPGVLNINDAVAGNVNFGSIRTVTPLTNVWTWTLPDKSGTFAMLSDLTGGTQSGSFTTLYSSGNSEIGNTSAATHNKFGTAANAAGVLNEIGSLGAGSMTIVNGAFTLNSLAGTNGILQATTGVVSTGNLSGDVTTTNSLVTTINNTTVAGNHIVAALNSPATAKSMNADVINYDATMHVASHAIGIDLTHANTWTGTQTFPSQVYAPSDGTIGNPVQNNWSLPANNTYFRISSAAPADLTGIAAGTAGQILILMNVGVNAITLKELSGSSLAANQFDLAGGGDIILGPKGSIMLIYDGGFSKWMIVRY